MCFKNTKNVWLVKYNLFTILLRRAIELIVHLKQIKSTCNQILILTMDIYLKRSY